jgi:tellurite resistance protein TerC
MVNETLILIVLTIVVLVMLILDLGVFHRKAHVIRIKEALIWSAVWISLALLFNIGVFIWFGSEKALLFLTGYLIEESLSVDNLFVFLMIFSYFKVPPIYQHRVLFWGIIGALIMRAVFIFTGVTLITKFHWLIYIFGAFLVVTGIRMIFQADKEVHPERNPVLKLFRKLMPISASYQNGKFFIKQAGKTLATPLFVVLLVVETSDVMFALDSIPAIFAITVDPFIVYSSNIFAILGLRSLYFALAGIMGLFQYLHYGLSAILIFVGIKMLIADFYKMPVSIALGVVAAILLISILLSVWRTKTQKISTTVATPEKVPE